MQSDLGKLFDDRLTVAKNNTFILRVVSALSQRDRHQSFANLPAAMCEEFVAIMTGEFCRATSALRGIMVRTL
jgi:hypothetical protein